MAAWVLVSIILSTCVAHSFGQEPSTLPENPEVAVENAGAPVEIDGRPILVVYARVGGFTPEERARAIEQRIVSLARNRSIPIDAIHSENRGAWTEIIAGTDRIMGITEADAAGAERARPN